MLMTRTLRSTETKPMKSVAQRVKVLVTQSDDLNSIPGTHVVREENLFTQIIL